jgi:3-oxoacyl-[acyl-carrier protein] reductase
VNKPLDGKIALVTGASRGIGAAIARRLAADGAFVYVHYAHRSDRAAAICEEIAGDSGRASAIQADLSDPDSIDSMFKTLSEGCKLDILVNNAGVAEFRPLALGDADHYSNIFDVNVRGVYLCTQKAVGIMQTGGRIINISSGAARAGGANASVYAASKAAVEAMTSCLATELGPQGITVNCISPGITVTDMLASAVPAPVQQQLLLQTPLGRIGQPEDIADVAAFLASDAARWVTGQTIAASGGLR